MSRDMATEIREGDVLFDGEKYIAVDIVTDEVCWRVYGLDGGFISANKCPMERWMVHDFDGFEYYDGGDMSDMEQMAKRDQQHEVRTMTMTVDEYQDAAAKTRDHSRVGQVAVDYARLSLKGEIGELCELLKKRWYHGVEVSDERVMDEMGDVLWSCAEWCTARGVRLRNLILSNDWDEYQSYRVAADHPRALLLDTTHRWGPCGVVGALADLATAWGYSMEVIASANAAKLADRYPKGFVRGGGVR